MKQPDIDIQHQQAPSQEVVERALRYAREIAPTREAVELYDKAIAAMKAGVIVHVGGTLSFPVDYLKVLEDESWDLRCVSSGDDDVEWQVIGHWMAQPQERTIGYGRNPKAAIMDAMRPRDYDGNLLNEIEGGKP